MKIGVLTLRLHKNYGGILQNYALTKVLEMLGHEVETINIFWDIRPKGLNKVKIVLKRIVKKYVLQRKIDIWEEERILAEDVYTTVNTKRFKTQYNHLSKEVYVVPGANFSPVNNLYDAIVVGSDQVWRPRYTMGVKKYFLDFISNPKIKKLSYAASFGTEINEYSKEDAAVCGKLIERFDGVSVREKSGIKLIREDLKWNVRPQHHIDPTLLLDPADYMFKGMVKEPSNNLFVYILDIDLQKQKVIDQIANYLSISPNQLLAKGLRNEGQDIIPSVEDWLSGIMNASFVITDSFHGCVFSILFHKPFIVYGNSERGMARFDSVLKTFGLEDRFINTPTQLTTNLIDAQIDWEKVESVRRKEKERSIKYLTELLK